MSTLPFEKPRLPSNYYVWCDPPDASGDETLHFVCERRRLSLKGHSFRDFMQKVVPLLDGRHSLAEIEAEVADIFRPEDLEDCLRLLAEQNLLEGADHGLDESAALRMEPQLNLFHEMSGQTATMQKGLSQATVAVLGLGGAGAGTALSLAAAGVGTLYCIDALPIRESDVYFSPFFQLRDVGTSRAATVARLIERAAPQVKARVAEALIETEDDVEAAIDGAGFVVCCLDAGQSNLIFKLNRACLEHRIRWTSCTLSGSEVILGPTVHPFEGACYLCYRMRSVACAGNPEDAFAFERYLDRRRQDDSGRRENLVFGAGMGASLAGMEALKELTGLAEPSAAGKIAIFNLLGCSLSKHVVLRKPWCPDCFGKEREAPASLASLASTGGES